MQALLSHFVESDKWLCPRAGCFFFCSGELAPHAEERERLVDVFFFFGVWGGSKRFTSLLCRAPCLQILLGS
jgi:hypothetical protein